MSVPHLVWAVAGAVSERDLELADVIVLHSHSGLCVREVFQRYPGCSVVLARINGVWRAVARPEPESDAAAA